MKVRKVVQITTDNYMEQQAIMGRFPDVVWMPVNGVMSKQISFYLPETKHNKVIEFMEEYKRLMKGKAGGE